MLKFLSKVKIEFNAFDPRAASALEFLAQCSSLKARDSNPSCQVIVNRTTDDHHPEITITYSNGVEESIDGSITNAQTIRKKILETGRMLETQQMFKEAGQSWPVKIPEEELYQFAKPTKDCQAQSWNCSCHVQKGMSTLFQSRAPGFGGNRCLATRDKNGRATLI